MALDIALSVRMRPGNDMRSRLFSVQAWSLRKIQDYFSIPSGKGSYFRLSWSSVLEKKIGIVSLTSSISQLHSTPTSHDIMSMGKWIQARSFEVSMDGVVARSVRDKIVICCCRNGAHALKTGTHYILDFSWSYIRPPARSWFDRNMREYSKERISFSL